MRKKSQDAIFQLYNDSIAKESILEISDTQ